VDIIGKKIGRYDILAHIGEGGMAQVYSAFDPEIDRTVALKILKEEHCQDEERMSRFLKEGKAAGALTHPNIVTVYDVGELEGAPYIMMELLEGKTLGDLLQDNVRLPINTILDIAAQLADALDYAHGRGVVHRDMKPDNIVLSSDYRSLKITDFGIARMESVGEKENTQVGMMLGTPRYMSPEQANGERVDGRSDLFAAGVILYELITGKKAFDAESMPTLIMQIVQKDPLPIRQITSDAPVGLQKIVGKLLQKKPAKRFQSGRELRAAIDRELQILQEQEEETGGYMPLQVKWTAIMTALVALTMSISAFFVFRAQSEVLTQQAIDGGVSLSKFVAVQAAIPVLGEDWVTLDSFVQDAAARQSFSYLTVSDHNGTIKAASDSTLVDTQWEAQEDAEEIYRQGDVRVTDLDDVFNFSLPVLFNDTVVGNVNMGLDTRQLDSALGTTKRLMAILGFSVVLAVTLVIYIFNKLIAKNLLLATRAVRILGQGNMETRISKQRADEFGELFSAFNGMADSLEKMVDTHAADSEKGGIDGSSALEEAHPDISGITQASVDDITMVRMPKDDDAK
jgi:eukaryotic-like serine/threonine-protein kinase